MVKPFPALSSDSVVTSPALEAFFGLPKGDIIYEFIDGQAVPKFNNSDKAPKFFHSSITGALFVLLGQWSQQRGRVRIEWAVSLTHANQSWVPVPDLTYISFNRLPADWMNTLVTFLGAITAS